MTFRDKALRLRGHNVRVTTRKGTFTGRLTSVGTDFLVLSSITGRRRRNRIIRLVEIIALLSLLR
ncbi:DUF2642 domain-containing protein [Paenibacillus profundus]|uniref:DUF2642 domain-containing protein n=1 Tax=Paenibacillus profundus TaxID=1173085 RepID=A0ABS8YD86_9BACL|nr:MULTISPECIES: DUF2642 domain-containing protein [Paenibacillus]MCE5168844.1 DUF2642 domain-containing protein [Paenibacillus profundus]